MPCCGPCTTWPCTPRHSSYCMMRWAKPSQTTAKSPAKSLTNYMSPRPAWRKLSGTSNFFYTLVQNWGLLDIFFCCPAGCNHYMPSHYLQTYFCHNFFIEIAASLLHVRLIKLQLTVFLLCSTVMFNCCNYLSHCIDVIVDRSTPRRWSLTRSYLLLLQFLSTKASDLGGFSVLVKSDSLNKWQTGKWKRSWYQIGSYGKDVCGNYSSCCKVMGHKLISQPLLDIPFTPVFVNIVLNLSIRVYIVNINILDSVYKGQVITWSVTWWWITTVIRPLLLSEITYSHWHKVDMHINFLSDSTRSHLPLAG